MCFFRFTVLSFFLKSVLCQFSFKGKFLFLKPFELTVTELRPLIRLFLAFLQTESVLTDFLQLKLQLVVPDFCSFVLAYAHLKIDSNLNSPSFEIFPKATLIPKNNPKPTTKAGIEIAAPIIFAVAKSSV